MYSPLLFPLQQNRHSFCTGGYTSTYAYDAHIYTRGDSSWTQVASMSEWRENHSCGVARRGRNDIDVVVVGGPYGYTTSEIYSVATDSWRDGECKTIDIQRGSFSD